MYNLYTYQCTIYTHVLFLAITGFIQSPSFEFSFDDYSKQVISFPKNYEKNQNQVQTTTFIFKILNHRHNQHSSYTCILHRYSYTTIKFVFTARNFQPKL